MTYIVMAYIVKAYVVMAYIVMARYELDETDKAMRSWPIYLWPI